MKNMKKRIAIITKQSGKRLSINPENGSFESPPLIFIFLMTVAVFIACGQHRYPQSLLQADSLINIQPDSALSLLQDVSPETRQWSKADIMYHHLLMVKAADKTGELMTTANMIDALVNYYEDEGDQSLLPSAYYLAGRTRIEMQDGPAALLYFQKAAEVVKNDWRLKSDIFKNIQKHTPHSDLYNKSFQKHLLSTKSDSMISDSERYLQDINIVLNERKRFLQALDTLIRALNLASSYANDSSKTDKVSASFQLSDNLRRFEEALLHAQTAFDTLSTLNRIAIYSAALSMNKHLVDANAIKYDKELKNSYERYESIHDSLKHLAHTTDINQEHVYHSYQTYQKETQRLKTDIRQKMLVIYLCCLLIAVLSLIFAIYRKRQKKAMLMLRLSQQLKESANRPDFTREQTQTYRMIPTSRHTINQEESALKASDVYWRFLDYADKSRNPNKEEWKQLVFLLDTACNSFATKLRIMCRLSERDFRMCLLLRMGMSPLKIASILHIDKTSVSSQRRRLYKKHTGKNGSARDWDNFILSL